MFLIILLVYYINSRLKRARTAAPPTPDAHASLRKSRALEEGNWQLGYDCDYASVEEDASWGLDEGVAVSGDGDDRGRTFCLEGKMAGGTSLKLVFLPRS